MKIIQSRPPNYEAILAVFPGAAHHGVIFAYDDAIYNPSGQSLPDELIAHEQVHCDRQKLHPGGVEGWWDQYLVDANFRYEEELLAHIAEYQGIVSKYRYGEHAMARVKKSALEFVAKKMAAPLYGRVVTVHQAMTAIRLGAANGR